MEEGIIDNSGYPAIRSEDGGRVRIPCCKVRGWRKDSCGYPDVRSEDRGRNNCGYPAVRSEDGGRDNCG